MNRAPLGFNVSDFPATSNVDFVVVYIFDKSTAEKAEFVRASLEVVSAEVRVPAIGSFVSLEFDSVVGTGLIPEFGLVEMRGANIAWPVTNILWFFSTTRTRVYVFLGEATVLVFKAACEAKS